MAIGVDKLALPWANYNRLWPWAIVGVVAVKLRGLMQIACIQFLCRMKPRSASCIRIASRGCWMTNNRYSRKCNKISQLCNQIPDTVYRSTPALSRSPLTIYFFCLPIWLDNWGTRNHVEAVVVVVFLWPFAQKRRQLCPGHNGQIGHVLQIVMARGKATSMGNWNCCCFCFCCCMTKKCTPSHLSLKLKSLP